MASFDCRQRLRLAAFGSLRGTLPFIDGAACAVMPPPQAPAASLGDLVGPRVQPFFPCTSVLVVNSLGVSAACAGLSAILAWSCAHTSVSGGVLSAAGSGAGCFYGIWLGSDAQQEGLSRRAGFAVQNGAKCFGSKFFCCAITLSSFSLLQVLKWGLIACQEV